MKTTTVITIVLSVILAASGLPEVFAKGGDDNPVVAILDENGNTIKIDPDHNDVDVGSLPAVKIDPSQNDVDVGSLPAVKIDASQNDVDANVTNEVEVKNDSGFAILVDTGASARMPYAVRASDFSDNLNVIQNWDVPEGSIFVIEYVTARLTCISGCFGIVSARIEILTGGTPARAFLPTQSRTSSSSGHDSFAISETVRLYADPESQISFFAAAAPADSHFNGEVALSGYLIPAGEPGLAP